MKISVVTPCYNAERYIEQTLRSVLLQRDEGIDLEYILIDGGSTDGTLDIISTYKNEIDFFVSEADSGAASAINKGLARATGDVISWLNADDYYFSGTLQRVMTTMNEHPQSALCFGSCLIVDEKGKEIRRSITKFKELFFPISSRFTLQCINYISQPATFFRREAMSKAGLLRENLMAAWDYEYFLRLWQHGGGIRVLGDPLSNFRWHPQSISGEMFRLQFKEEWEVAAKDAGKCSLQALIHQGVRCGIVSIYTQMEKHRKKN